jgi:hypothetical protein
MIKSRRMWVGHVAHMGEKKVYRVLVGNLKERNHSEDQGIDGRMGSEWILGRLAGGAVELIHLARDRDLWQGLVDAMMNLWVLAPDFVR